MDVSTLTMIGGIITCLIGVATFIAGMRGRAANDGMLIQKINQALAGIDELKQDFRAQASMERSLELRVQAHDEQIKSLFKSQEELTETNKILTTIAESIALMNRRNPD